MPSIPLPENPSLEHLKSQAKLIRDLIRDDDPGGISMIDEFHPRLDADGMTADQRRDFKTTDAQLLVARLYGFESWARLRKHLTVLDELSFRPEAEAPATDDEADDRVSSFVSNACLDYSGSDLSPTDRIAEAQRMLDADPTLASGNVAAMAAAGDHRALAGHLDQHPAAVNEPTGPNRWPPLLYATYSRVHAADSERSAIATVQLLLSRGANPNSGFLWRGLVPPFTALTGAFGRGESHQPPHPDRLELARLLLEAGADPNDGQTLYNNGIGGQNHDDPAHLELLVAHGLGTARQGPWHERLGDQLRDPAELLYDELEAAVKRNRPSVLRFLVSLDLDLDRPIGRSGQRPVRIASAEGHGTILDILAEAGLDIDTTPTERALQYTRSGDVDDLRLLLDRHDGLLEQLRTNKPGLVRMVDAGQSRMLKFLLERGFDINDRSTTKTALHDAAEAGDPDRARMLLEHGADPNLVDTHIGAPPLGWANYFHQPDAAAVLEPVTEQGDPLPDVRVQCLDEVRIFATPSLVTQHLERLDRTATEPVLVTIRTGPAALTIGVGHPTLSVALLLDQDKTPWHAAGPNPIDDPIDDPVEFRDSQTTRRFNRYLPAALVRAAVEPFLKHPDQKPPPLTWAEEGP